jgi:hypothetical protein
MSMPTLWTHVYVQTGDKDGNAENNGGDIYKHAGSDDNFQKMQLSLYLSRETALTLHIFLTPEMDDSWVNSVNPHVHRINEIRLRHHSNYNGNYRERHELLRRGLEALSKLSSLSALKKIDYLNSIEYPHLCIVPERVPSMPQLQTILGFHISVSTLGEGQDENSFENDNVRESESVISLSELRDFSSESSLRELHHFIIACPRLEHLHLQERQEEPIPNLDVNLFPLLKTFIFDRIGVNAIKPILTQRGERLTTLHVQLTWYDMANTKFLGYLPNLTHLRIYCPRQGNPEDKSPLTFPSLPKVREFHFGQRPAIFSHEAAIMPIMKMTSLFEAIYRSMPNIEVLDLNLFDAVPIDFLLHCLVSLKYVRHFELSHDKLLYGVVTERAVLPTVEDARFCNDLFLKFVDLPNLRSLWIDCVPFDDPIDLLLPNASFSRLKARGEAHGLPSSPSWNTHTLKGDRYPRLKELKWMGHPFPDIATVDRAALTQSFSSITRLVFGEPLARRDCNNFCELILRHPTSCPRLDFIAVHCYPSWDLLLHMLLRRNFMPGREVASIKTLQLPGYPSIGLMQPITSLLRQRLPTMPPLSQIALSSHNGLFEPMM